MRFAFDDQLIVLGDTLQALPGMLSDDTAHSDCLWACDHGGGSGGGALEVCHSQVLFNVFDGTDVISLAPRVY